MNVGGMNGSDWMEVAIDGGREGFNPGEQVAASGSFKLRDGLLVSVAAPAPEAP